MRVDFWVVDNMFDKANESKSVILLNYCNIHETIFN